MKKSNRTTQPSNAASPGSAQPGELELQCRFCGHTCPPELEEMPCQNCKADTYFRFIPPGTPRNYREILKFMGLRDRAIAEAFGYKDLNAFSSSTAAKRVKAGVEFVFYSALFINRG